MSAELREVFLSETRKTNCEEPHGLVMFVKRNYKFTTNYCPRITSYPVDNSEVQVLEAKLTVRKDYRYHLVFGFDPPKELDEVLLRFESIYHISDHPLPFRVGQSISMKIQAPDQNESLNRLFWGRTNDEDERLMKLATEMATLQQGQKPHVGAVLVANDNIITANKSHLKRNEKYGANIHAERYAIKQAEEMGVNLYGSTLYTTLEPCLTEHRNIEGCAELIASKGISRVVVGSIDNFGPKGRGIDLLLSRGVKCHIPKMSGKLQCTLKNLRGNHNTFNIEEYLSHIPRKSKNRQKSPDFV